MSCRVRYLNSAGIHPREIPGIESLAQALPAQWLLYASLQCYPPRSHPIEIDALIVADDRVIILEIKDYYGTLSCNGDQWILNGQPRGRSAVDMVSDKARKIKGIFGSTIPGFSKFPVYSRVVLTGSANKTGLSPAEQPSVWTLNEACSIANSAAKTALLGPGTLHLKKAFQYENDFERITRNARQFRPAEGNWDGYRVVEEDLVVHPKLIWREHRAERMRDTRFKALLRIWSFDKLPPGLNSADHRRFIADRETRAIGLLHDLGSRLVNDGSILLPTGEDKQEILTQHFELRQLPRDWLTLDRFLERGQSDLSLEDRLLSASTLLNAVAELHANGIAHRDLGPRSVWIGAPSKLALSGFMACQIPGEDSVGDWHSTLRGYSSAIPEDSPGAEVGSAKQRDVFAAGRLIGDILDNKAAAESASIAFSDMPALFGDLRACLDRATAAKPSARYENAIVMKDDFAAALERAEGKTVDQSILDRAETPDVPYVRYLQHKMLKQTTRVNVYLHRASNDDQLVVKLWLGMRRGESVAIDLALTSLVEGAKRLIVSPVESLPQVVDVGLSPVGPFVVYRYVDGTTLDQVGPLSAASAVDIAEKLLHAIDALHAMDLHHGDISDKNVILAADGSAVSILDLFDLSKVGVGLVRTTKYCPEGWEKLTEQQIDRYAALKLSTELLISATDERLATALSVLTDEMQRQAIETFEPGIIALKEAGARLREPPPPRSRVL